MPPMDIPPVHGGDIPRPKRIACVICRKRKLRCDGNKPSCGTCSRLGHDCAYDEVRRKSGPKRGYVKALEARLAQVETLLKGQDPATAPTDPQQFAELSGDPSIHVINKENPVAGLQAAHDRRLEGSSGSQINTQDGLPTASDTLFNFGTFDNMPIGDTQNMENITMGWDLMSMGVEEPLPSQETQDALYNIFFEKVYTSIPIIHKGRYMASLDYSPQMRPPICLRYAMWTLAASIEDEYFHLQTHFYRMARKYVEDTELKGHGELLVNVSMAQTWTFIACYEFKLMYFPRAWMSTGRAVRLSQMMGLHRLDGNGLEVKQCLPPAKDWTEREERRRTFWMAFCVDRYASIGTGWPMTIEEKDLMTNLPASEESFDRGRPSKSLTLKEAMTADGARHLSPFAGVVLMACLFGRNLIHLHRPDDGDEDNDLNGEFWRRHRHMDNILLNIALSLPAHFKLPNAISDPNIVFVNMNIHTSTICLHQAAIFKAEKNRMPATVSAESKIRCITAAAEIASIMRMIAHMDISGMNPFLSFCLYVAARVFVQYLKTRPKDDQVRASLEFLLTAMGHIKKKNPLTESFLVQLDVDLAGMLDEPTQNNKFPYGLKKGQAEGYNPCDDQTSTASPESSTTGDGSGLSSATIGRSPFMFCPNDNPQMRETPGGPKHTRLPPQQAFNMNMSSTSNETSPSNSVEMPECSGLTPASSVEHGSPQQSTPLTQSSNSFSPIDDSMGDQMGLPYQGITPGQRTGFTPMPDNTLSPGKEMPWAMLDFDNNNPEMTGGMNLFDLFQGGSYQ